MGERLRAGDHGAVFVAEVIDEGGAHVGGAGAGDAVAARTAGFPRLVDFPGSLVVLAAVEEDDALAPLAVGKEAEQVVLCAAGLGEDDRFLRTRKVGDFVEGDIIQADIEGGKVVFR